MDAICKPIALAPCTSDVHTVWAGAIGDRHNMILGHEAVGEVVEVGSLVRDFKVGDKVLVIGHYAGLELQSGPGRVPHAFRRHAGGLEVFEL